MTSSVRIADVVGDVPRRDETETLWYAGALTFLIVVARLAVRPYSTYLLSQLPGARPIGANVKGDLLAIFLDAGLSYVVIRVSLRGARHVELAWPPLDGWGAGADGATRRRDSVITAILLGAAVALLLAVAQALIGDRWPMRPMHPPPIWMAILVSPGAGIYEEIWFRLGAMTLAARLLKRLTGGSGSAPGIIWTANLAAALLFGAAHLPLLSALTAFTPSAAAYVILANGCVGVACGWLYWRRGLVAAMIAHTSVDLVLKVAMPLIWMGA